MTIVAAVDVRVSAKYGLHNSMADVAYESQ